LRKNQVPADFLNSASVPISSSTSGGTIIATPQPFIKRHQSISSTINTVSTKPTSSLSSTQLLKIEEDENSMNFDYDAVSPPSSPTPGLKIIPDPNIIRKGIRTDPKCTTDHADRNIEMKSDTPVFNGRKIPQLTRIPSPKSKQQSVQLSAMSKNKHGIPFSKQRIGMSNSQPVLDSDMVDTDYKFIERFNRDMMDQFMEHQRRTQASFTRWEQERWKQERETMERWRQEARDHERQLFGMFCAAMTKCNAALTSVMRARVQRQNKPNLIDNALIVPNGTEQINRARIGPDHAHGIRNFDININESKKRKYMSEHIGTHKIGRISKVSEATMSSPTASMHGESDVPEQDSPTFDSPYMNENSMDEPAESSLEESEKHDLDDVDRGDD